MKYKLLIFDLDGLMFDTEKMYYNSWFKFTDEFGFKFDNEVRKKIAGMNEIAIRDYLSKEVGGRKRAEELRQKLIDYRSEYFNSYTKSLKKDGLVELLDFCKENEIRTCVASSSDRDKIEFLLDKEVISKYFDFIISGSDVENSKPHPEIFIRAAEIAGVDKKDALVLEDSYNGYLAGKASGIDYLVIHDSSFEKYFKSDREALSLYDVIDFIK